MEKGVWICHVNYGKLRDYTLAHLKEWESLINLDNSKAYKS